MSLRGLQYWARMKKKAPPTPERFTGFADRTGRFFKALAKHQEREWFKAHREDYDQGWLNPMLALLGEVRQRVEPLFPREELAGPKVFRIYRDVRFSKDKSPYKTHLGGYLALGGAKAGPSMIALPYVHIGADGVFAAVGQYMMDPAQLADFRAGVTDDVRGADLAKLLQKLTRAGFTVGSYGQLKRVPRGSDPEHPRADLLKRKGLVVTFPPVPRELLVSPKLVGWLVTQTKRTVPLVEWLAAVSL